MAVTKELIAKNGTYKNKQGEEKTRYIKVGVKMETEKGTMLKIEALPVPFDGWVYERDLQEKTGAVATKASIAELDDSVPF